MHEILLALLAILLEMVIPSPLLAQDDSSYELLPAPDIWYNSVDGVRVGLRLRGQVPGTFEDGPHRLNAGLWLGTNIPDNPVSYYLRFTEPIPSISDFGSEGNVRMETLYRTGFQSHGLSFNKRWQTGFNEQNYKKLSIGFRSEKRFNTDYLLYRQLWQTKWLYLIHASFDYAHTNRLGRFRATLSLISNVGESDNSFVRSEIDVRQQVELSDLFSISSRFYSGFATEHTTSEYLYSHSFNSPRNWMSSGLTRARGTIPPGWMKIGNIQIAGGPNLRGYLSEDVEALNAGFSPLYTSISAINLEFNYANPLDHALKTIPVAGGLVDLRSYLFWDTGTSLGLTSLEESRTISDAGLGFQFSLNIPDYLGKARGLFLRYDIPFWLSHPGNDNHVAFRQVFGIGATISL